MTDYEQMRAELEKMTMKQLKQIAKEEGICLGYDAARKDTCIGAIIMWRRNREIDG